MRNVLALGAAILVVGAASMSFAQERLQTNQSGLGGNVDRAPLKVAGQKHRTAHPRLGKGQSIAQRSGAADGGEVLRHN